MAALKSQIFILLAAFEVKMGFNALMADHDWLNLASTTCDGEAVQMPSVCRSTLSRTVMNRNGERVSPCSTPDDVENDSVLPCCVHDNTDGN
ncbi:hypothetical protein ACOMHN_011658 [Nucella lapillus]